MPEGLLIILRSDNGRDGWTPLKPDEVPEWLKQPDVMAHLVGGDMCCDPSSTVEDNRWYRAERLSSEGETKQ